MKRKYLVMLLALPVALVSCGVKGSDVNNTNNDTITKEELDGDKSYTVSYVTDSHVSVYVYNSQDYTTSPEKTDSSVTRDGDGNATMVDGQVNFLLVFDDGYELDSISALEGTYKNIKTPSDTQAYNVYRITKITADTTVTISSKPVESSEVRTSYTASFNLDSHVKVYFYDTQDYTVEPYAATEALSRDGETGLETILGGQINFKVMVDEGYEIRGISATENTYANIKLVDEDNLIYRITKISADTVVNISSKLIGDDSINTTYNGEDYTLNCDVLNASYTYADNNLVITCDPDAVSTVTLSGSYYGCINIKGESTSEVKIIYDGFNMISDFNDVFVIDDMSDSSISLQEGTNNSIKDIRASILEEYHSAAIYSACDLDVKGKGSITIDSLNGNGIHSKDDLKIKNANLEINVLDNALKGNDSVTIESGTYKLISRAGDGIKTSNSGLKTDGITNKGSITISGGTLNIYTACDGIDAAYDVVILNDPVINIYTDKYSSYSEEVTAVSESKMYIKASNTTYNYSIYFYNDETDGKWVNSGSYSYVNGGYYYELSKPSGYSSMIIYVYTKSQAQGSSTEYYTAANATINSSYDTISYSSQRNSFSWTNYQTQSSRPGMGGMQEGNQNKSDYSTKGIKADNSITISGGEIYIESYDDGIHVNSDVVLESGNAPLGSINISGGVLTVKSNDDGIHADNTLTISGGEICVKESYEGLEANIINISGGDIFIYATDDGINASGSNAKIIVSGGYTNVLVSTGDTDAVDSNGTYSQTGGVLVAANLSTQGMATALDTDQSVSIGGGVILCFGNIEKTPSLSGVSSKTVSLSLSAGNYVLYDSNNNVIAEFTLKTSYSKLYIAAKSGSYKLVGNTSVNITL